jgi:hypothetical protein
MKKRINAKKQKDQRKKTKGSTQMKKTKQELKKFLSDNYLSYAKGSAGGITCQWWRNVNYARNKPISKTQETPQQKIQRNALKQANQMYLSFDLNMCKRWENFNKIAKYPKDTYYHYFISRCLKFASFGIDIDFLIFITDLESGFIYKNNVELVITSRQLLFSPMTNKQFYVAIYKGEITTKQTNKYYGSFCIDVSIKLSMGNLSYYQIGNRQSGRHWFKVVYYNYYGKFSNEIILHTDI